MGKKFTRQELYDLVWSEPTRTAAKAIGVSDVALAKACRKANIPIPERGYWARKQALKPTVRALLLPRFPGASDTIEIGGSSRGWDPHWEKTLLETPIPPPPTFDEEMAAVQQRIQKMVGKVPFLRNFNKAHPIVTRLLGNEEKERAYYASYGSTYYKPKYDSGLQRRWLLILNSLFLALQSLGCRPDTSTSKYLPSDLKDRDISVAVGDQHIYFTLAPPPSPKAKQAHISKAKEPLRLALGSSSHSDAPPKKYWEDTEESSLEDSLTEIVIQVLLTAEEQHRNAIVRNREWLIKRKAEVAAEIRRRQEEQERQARELKKKQEKERIDRLIGQAGDFHKSATIRAYVQAVRENSTGLSMSPRDLENWTQWALKEADRIDPVRSMKFLELMLGGNESCPQSDLTHDTS